MRLIPGFLENFDHEPKIVEPTGIKPIAAFTASKTVVQEDEIIDFTDQSTNSSTQWKWDFGDGIISTLQNPAHSYNTAGQYIVKLTASNNFGSDTKERLDYITVNPPGYAPIAASTASKTTLAVGQQIWL